MDEESVILNNWQQQENIFIDNLHLSRKKPTKDSVHDLRVAIKRMRSYLRLKKQINGGEWKDSFSKIASLFKSFGRLRNLDMSITLLRKHEHKEHVSFPFFKEYLFVNRSLTRKWAKQDALKFDEVGLKPLGQQFISLQQPPPEIYKTIILLSEKKIKKVKDLEDQFEANAHEIRKQLKDVYYWIQICPKESAQVFLDLKALDKMLDHLGSWQDNFIMNQKTKRYRKDLAREDEKQGLEDFETNLETESKELFGKAQSKWKDVLI